MPALPRNEPVSISDYLAGEELAETKHEYLGGSVHAMSGASNRHNAIAGNAFAHLHTALASHPCRPFNSDTKVRVDLSSHTRFYYPDAMVVCVPNPETEHYQDRPVVIIEVLSESTRRLDLGEKLDAYLTLPSLKLLLLVEQDAAAVTVHRRGSVGGFTIEHHVGLEAVIDMPEIDAALPLSAIYARIAFDEA